MYRRLIRPVLFLVSPERIHHLLVRSLKILFKIHLIYPLIKNCCTIRDERLKTEFLGLTFDSPVGLAAGFDKNAEVFNEFHAFGFSFIEVGTVTPLGQPGNPRPRSFRIPADRGLINRMGFNNKGAASALRNLSGKRRSGLIIGGNIGKNTATSNEDAVADYEACFRELYDVVDYFVVNVSCPNISDLHKLQDQDALEAILSRILDVRSEMKVKRPVLLKISPDLNKKQLDETLKIISELGIDGIVATNTTVSREGLVTDPERIRGIGQGGLSGAPITTRSLEMVGYIAEKTSGNLPIIGVGGIMSVQDALNMLDAGATLVQVYTGFIYEGPGLAKRINKAVLSRQSSPENLP